MRGVQDTARRLPSLVEHLSNSIRGRGLTVFCFVNKFNPFVSFLDHSFQLLLSRLQLGADMSPLGIEIKNLLLESLNFPLLDLMRSRDIQGTGDLRVTLDEG